MSNLEKLYYELDKLYDGHADTEEVIKMRDNVERVLGEDDYMKYEDEINAYTSAIEKQGFVTGFRYAVSLLTTGGKESVLV